VGCFLLGLLEQARRRDVSDVISVELHECQLENETHQVVEVIGVEDLRVKYLLETTLRHAVVARVELERRAAVLDDVAVDVDAGFEVVQFVLALVELEDFGRDALVSG